MRKIIIAAVFLLFASLNSYAIEREFGSDKGEPTHTIDTAARVVGQTNVERLGVSGSQVAGNPGYVSFMSCNTSGFCYPFYLWFDAGNGKLCTASYPTISTYASFPTGDWRTGMPCTVVGSQT